MTRSMSPINSKIYSFFCASFHIHFAYTMFLKCYTYKIYLELENWNGEERAISFEPFKYTNMCGCKQQSYKKQKDQKMSPCSYSGFVFHLDRIIQFHFMYGMAFFVVAFFCSDFVVQIYTFIYFPYFHSLLQLILLNLLHVLQCIVLTN